MSADYVRKAYAVEFRRGDRMILHDHAGCTTPDGWRCPDTSHDRQGVIVSFPGAYVGIRFDGEKHTSRCHPTWQLGTEESE